DALVGIHGMPDAGGAADDGEREGECGEGNGAEHALAESVDEEVSSRAARTDWPGAAAAPAPVRRGNGRRWPAARARSPASGRAAAPALRPCPNAGRGPGCS